MKKILYLAVFSIAFITQFSCKNDNSELKTYQFQFENSIKNGAFDLSDSSGYYIMLAYSESCESCRKKVLDLFTNKVNCCLLITHDKKNQLSSNLINNEENCIILDGRKYAELGFVNAFPILIKLNSGQIEEYTLLDESNFSKETNFLRIAR